MLLLIKKNENSWARRTYGEGQRCIEGFGEEICGKETTRRRGEGSIKIK
jgi:hypothetical protein